MTFLFISEQIRFKNKSNTVVLASIITRNPPGYDPLEICIENCALCKKMLGAWFEGPLCAESCIKYKGKLVPECEDYASIAPFLNKL
ncbi:unnamed protein product [Euphydryas editha]|uniref:Eclosion hormone n=1 Tax=Euphydryas editha TaxID=104508 RepID=A0AAU9TIL4_EUPED|nr:unnamed protein product [Euphydryas editha]